MERGPLFLRLAVRKGSCTGPLSKTVTTACPGFSRAIACIGSGTSDTSTRNSGHLALQCAYYDTNITANTATQVQLKMFGTAMYEYHSHTGRCRRKLMIWRSFANSTNSCLATDGECNRVPLAELKTRAEEQRQHPPLALEWWRVQQIRTRVGLLG